MSCKLVLIMDRIGSVLVLQVSTEHGKDRFGPVLVLLSIDRIGSGRQHLSCIYRFIFPIFRTLPLAKMREISLMFFYKIYIFPLQFIYLNYLSISATEGKKEI